MNVAPGYLLDEHLIIAAGLEVTQDGDLYSGTVHIGAMDGELLALFRRFEELVENQLFTLADEVEEGIAQHRLTVLFADGTEAVAEDLQIYPSTNRVTFRARALADRR